MKNILIAFFLVSSTLAANANTIQQNVNSELAKVESEMDACGVVMPVNRLIAQGKNSRTSSQIIDALINSLKSDRFGNAGKSGAAMALGHIGNARAVPALKEIAATATDSMLKSIAQDSISLIDGEFASEGKIYVYSFAIKKLKTDCEAGTSEVVK